MVRVIMLSLLISPLSFAGDNYLSIITKGTGTNITTKQVGNGNSSYVLCGANSSGSFPGTTELWQQQQQELLIACGKWN